MEPTDALRSIETALRLAIRDVLGRTEWLKAAGAPAEATLRDRQAEERKRRDGAIVSNDLLEYTETVHLIALIDKNWEAFKPVFNDRARTKAFLGIVADVRNSIAHSRNLVPFERDLIAGVAGQLRNQVSLFRSGKNKSSRYYPLIESIKDGFGIEGYSLDPGVTLVPSHQLGPRLDVGTVLRFTGSAFNARGRPVMWFLTTGWSTPKKRIEVAIGDSVTFDYSVTTDDVAEGFYVRLLIAADSAYHRWTNDPYAGPHDDSRRFSYEAVNPPEEE